MNEIKKTRLKFFFVTSGIILIMIAVFCAVILINMHIRNQSFTKEMLDHAVYRPQPPMDEQTQTVTARKGFEDMRANEFVRLLWTTLSIGFCSLIILVSFVWFLSYWVIKPAKAGFDKQRRFIAEASHELRTPLTVISTGLELLSRKKGDHETQKWLSNIREQTNRMSVMTNDLLTLSRLDETEKAIRREFDISRAVNGEITAFECVAFEHGKQITADIVEDIIYNGDENAVRQAVSILLDNAIKHSAEKSDIEIALSFGKHIMLSVTNLGDLTEDELPYIFERFYRGSESRAKTVGTGLGLAILKNLSAKNGWQIDMRPIAGKKLCFSILF